MTLENVASTLALLGIGGLLGTYFRILWERKNSALLQKQEFKEVRYKCVIILLLAYLDFEKSKTHLHRQGRENINTLQDLEDELLTEWNNMILFASEEVLFAMKQFLKNPSYEKFIHIAINMRKDLWGGSISLKSILKMNTD
ncbi:MAG: hypothetical protein A2252_09630 [Elusimicrobia bacterium RIFOXYA2_FULL_39_19]|nr:MAG: hypothetical protein A2252_09630 [Elusimicrobia bacterium RIFOXYA2_FULL_39_19]